MVKNSLMNQISLGLGEDLELIPPSDLYDFKGWIHYFSKVSSLNIASMSGSTYENCISNFKKFLHTFPWLYAYWDKLANFMWSGRCELSTTKEIFTMALSKNSLYYSIDMWLCCIRFFKINLPQTEQDKMRLIYSSALDAVGGHYCSGKLWRLALNYEDENRRSTFPLLAKAVSCSTSDLKQFWAELQIIFPKVPLIHFQIFLSNRDKKTIELLSLFDQSTLAPSQTNDLDLQKKEDDTEERSIYINDITEIYNSSLIKVSERSIFEENINRHFFHFNAPDDVQISNWEKYTTFLKEKFVKVSTKENFNDVVLTYERALIPCAFIDAIWIQYTNFLEDCLDSKLTTLDEIRAVFKRMPFRVMPSSKIIYAEFEEVYSPAENAPIIYAEMEQSKYAEQIIASASYHIRNNPIKTDASSTEGTQNFEHVCEILRNGRNRLLEEGDIDGASTVAAFLLDFANEASDISGAVYISKYAKKFAISNPEEVNNYFFNAIYTTPLHFEDKLNLLRIYIEYMRQHGTKASFQLELEMKYNRSKNKLIWNKDYFDQKFILSKQGPERKLKEWINYMKEINE